MYFSFDYGIAHFITISTEYGYPKAPFGDDDGNQLRWLEQDLMIANKNRDQVPWIFVIGHRPIYSAAKDDHVGDDPDKDEVHLQEAIESLLHEYQVNVYFTGHVHLYERQWPVYQDQVVSFDYNSPNSTVHIVSGAAGNVENLNSFNSPPPSWHAFGYNEDQGYGLLTVLDSKNIYWAFYNDKNVLIDNVTISNWYLQ